MNLLTTGLEADECALRLLLILLLVGILFSFNTSSSKNTQSTFEVKPPPRQLEGLRDTTEEAVNYRPFIENHHKIFRR